MVEQDLYKDLECPHVDNCAGFEKRLREGTLPNAPCIDSTKYLVHETICYKPRN